MTKRVCHVLGSSRREGTGIAKIVASLHRHIDPKRYETSACFVGGNGPLVENFIGLGIPVNVVPWRHPSRDVAGAIRLARYLRSEHFDVIHFHWGGRTLRHLVRLLTTSKIILHLHSEIEEGMPGRGKIPTSGADLVIAVSKSVARVSDHQTTRVVYSGVEIIRDQIRHPEKNVIGFAGRLVPLKGLAYLFQAVASLSQDFPDLQVRVAGTGPQLEQLKAQAATLNLQEKVTFLGWLDDLSLERAQWEIAVQPSLDEGLPLGLLEAMAQGVPVVATRVGGIPEVVEDGINGLLLEAANAGELANALHKLLTESQAKARMGDAAMMTIDQRFSAQRMADSVSAIYDELLPR